MTLNLFRDLQNNLLRSLKFWQFCAALHKGLYRRRQCSKNLCIRCRVREEKLLSAHMPQVSNFQLLHCR